MRPVAIKVFQWPQVKTNEPETILRGILETDPILSRFQASEIFLVYNFPESNLIPEKFFSADMTRPVTDLIYGNLSQDLVLDEKIPWFEFHNVYRVPAEDSFSDAGKISAARVLAFLQSPAEMF